MATEKLNDGKSVRVTNAQVSKDIAVEEINGLNKIPSNKKNKAIRIICLIFLIIVLIVGARIPYVGSYIDSYVFEFIFGNAKYILYLWLILFLFFRLCNFKFAKILYTKRFIFGTFLILFGVIIGLSITQYILWQPQNIIDLGLFKKYTDAFNVWAKSSDAQTYKEFMPVFTFGSYTSSYIDSGIIGIAIITCWLYVTIAILCLIALLLITTGILMYLNKTDNRGVTLIKKWLVHLLGGSLISNSYDELAGEKSDNEPIVHQTVEIKNEALRATQVTPPISFLTDTSSDHYFDNKSFAEKKQNIIAKFIKSLSIDASYQNTTIMPQYSIIDFEVDSKNSIDQILKSQNELLKQLGTDSYNISFKGNLVRFEIPNKEISKISIRQIFNSAQNIQPLEGVIGITTDTTPLLLNINKFANTIIIGKRGSGGAVLLTCLLLSLAYTNQPEVLDFIILSPIGDKSLKYLDDLPHMQYPVISSWDDCVLKTHDLLKVIEEREDKFKSAGSKTIDDYNKYQNNNSAKIKKIIFTISSFDKMIKNNLQTLDVLSQIMERGPRVGIYTILLSINVNNETIEPKIYDKTDARFILRLESEQESLRMFDSYRGVQLCGNGDGYFINAGTNKKIRFQTCYLNANELIETIKIIKTFYLNKVN